MYREWVYFIVCDLSAMVKIGFSTYPPRRLEEIAPYSPTPLRIMAAFEGGRREEQELHRQFKAFRSHGEWFRFGGDLKAYVDGLGVSRWETRNKDGSPIYPPPIESEAA